MTPGERPETLIFLHVPKAAGSTLRDLLLRRYRPVETYATYGLPDDPDGPYDRFFTLPDAHYRRLRLVVGHVGFGLHDCLPQSAAYVTLLRDPLQRLLSNYHWDSVYPYSPFYADINAGRLDLRGYADHFAAFDSDNLQMRMLAGNWRKRGYGPATAAMTAAALANLRRHFLVVGVTGRFDEFLLLLRRRMGWGWPLYVRSNVAGQRLRVADLSPDDRTYLQELTRFDRQVVAEASRLLDAAVAAEGDSFQRELARFRRVNQAYGALYHSARRLYRRVRGRPAP